MEVEIFRNDKHSIMGRKLRSLLDGEDTFVVVKDIAGEGYARAGRQLYWCSSSSLQLPNGTKTRSCRFWPSRRRR